MNNIFQESWKLSFSLFSLIIIILFSLIGTLSIRLPCCPIQFPIFMKSKSTITTQVVKTAIIFVFALLGKVLGNYWMLKRQSYNL